MRISMINDEHFPHRGADTINVVRTASGLGEAGAEVDLVVPRLWGENLDLEALCDHYGVPATFRLVHVPTPLPTSRRLRLEKLTHSALAPWLAVLRRADVIYSRNFLPLAFAQRIGRPWVYETYRRFAEETPWLPKLTRRLPLDDALAAVVHSEGSGENLVRLGFPREAVFTAYSGYLEREVLPRLDKAEARRVCGLEDVEGPVVLLLGNVDPFIRLDWLLRIAQRLPQVTFLFVGGYPAQHAHWKGVFAEMGLENVRMVLHQPPGKVRQYLYTADVLTVVPRNADLETERREGVILSSLYSVLPGLPMKLFLYKATGLPIFAPNMPYLHEILTHEHDAMLAPLHDDEAATAMLARLLDDEALQARLGEASRTDPKLNTWSERGARILRFLEGRLQARR